MTPDGCSVIVGINSAKQIPQCNVLHHAYYLGIYLHSVIATTSFVNCMLNSREEEGRCSLTFILKTSAYSI